LVEGTSERLLLPRMIEKVDETRGTNLSSQYISTIEIGGAFAHRFFKLLEFLELRTLIVTDLDSAKKSEKKDKINLVACRVSEGTHTTNACLKKWFDDPTISPGQLVKKTANERTKGMLHLAHEVPEGAAHPCGRSFEAAFMLANPDLFALPSNGSGKLEEEVWQRTSAEIDKVQFALEFAIEKTTWSVPRYIADGLRWLAVPSTQSAPTPKEAGKGTRSNPAKARRDA